MPDVRRTGRLHCPPGRVAPFFEPHNLRTCTLFSFSKRVFASNERDTRQLRLLGDDMNTITANQTAAQKPARLRSLLLNGSLIVFGLMVPLVLGEIVARMTHSGLAEFDDHQFRR